MSDAREDDDARPGLLRRAGGALLLGTAFVATATLFAGLLRPIVEQTPAHAAVQAEARLDRVPRDVSAPPASAPAPTVAAAGKPPAVAAPPPDRPDGPLVAIVVTELGPNASAAAAAIERLPDAIDLAFSPYADASRTLSARAAEDGHAVWLSVPMQPKRYPRISPGENTLLTASTASENVQRLDWALARVSRPVGITNMMGSAFTESAAAMGPLAQALKARGLAYVDARSSGRTVGADVARRAGVPAAVNDRFLDEQATPAAIDANLAALEAIAKRQGSAVGFARALPVSIERLEQWSVDLEARGVKLVPVRMLSTTNG